MLSCPYETSVLHKCSFFASGASNRTTKKYFACGRRLFTLASKNNTNNRNNIKFNHQQGVAGTINFEEIISYNKAYFISSHCITLISQLLFLQSQKLIGIYHITGHGCQSLLVFVLLLLCYIDKSVKIKFGEILISHSRGKFQKKLALHYVTSGAAHYWLWYCVRSLILFMIQVEEIIKPQTSDFMNGSYFSSDMEVDAKSEVSKENLKEETKESYDELERSEQSECGSLIKDVRIMKEPECTQIHFKCVNDTDSIDLKCDSAEMVTNRDIVNCINENENHESKKLNSVGDATCAVVDGALLSNIKKEQPYIAREVNDSQLCNGPIIKKNESVIEQPNHIVIKDEKIDGEVKSINCNEIKDKTKSKSHGGHSNSSNVPSTKKVDDQSWSHHSSSSSSSRSKYKDYKSSSHRSSSSSKNCDRSKTSDHEKSKDSSSDKRKSRSCHHKSDEKCRCKSHSRHHSKSKKYQSVKTQCNADEIAYELRGSKPEMSNPFFTRVPWVPHPQVVNLKYGRFYRVETDRNGGATTVHLYMDEINHLNESQMKECAIEFIKLSYSEDENECAYHVMGIVHGAAAYLPDLVDYMADHYPTLTVKTGSLASRDNHTTTMSQYRDEVYKTYSNGTFRYAPLDQLSICGVLGEEVGAYFPDFVARLEQSPFMKPVMPWSSLSVVETDNPRESNDGPIFWVRPGEQMLPANEALKESARPKKRRNNELDNLAYIAGSRSSEARESLFMDRTKAHADQVGVDYGLSNTAPTAAVGVLKSVNCGHPEHGNRATKDVVAFHAQDYNELLEILMLDLYEPPQTQCTKWIEVSKLNTLRREGIRYAHVQLHDNDVYYLPRKIIHQFQTISSVASVAWHIRYKDYFSIMGAPNLHTPTGINKGQVFYEKKNVSVYYPPVCENDLLASVTNPASPLSKTPKKYDKLKDYSPFKHSPRKNLKIQSPRTSSKKGSDIVPQTPTKKEYEPVSNDEDKKGSSIKKERSKSDDRNETSSKKEHESSSSRKSDSNHLNDISSTKKERRENHEYNSNHRKEVKNLECEFDLKKNKSKSTSSLSKVSKSDRSGHESRRRSDEKSESSSRHKRHGESKSKSHSKYDKHRKTETPVSNGHVVESSVKSEEKHDKTISLKRKNSESQDSCPSKKVKNDKNEKDVLENGGLCEISTTFEDKSISESEMCWKSSVCPCDVADAKETDVENSKKNNFAIFINKVDENVDTVKDKLPNTRSDTNGDNESNSLCATSVKNSLEFNDLTQNISFPHGNSSSDINPPLPCTSPPSNPPLPPNSPEVSTTVLCTDGESHRKDENPVVVIASSPVTNLEETLPGSVSNQQQAILSKEKSNDVLLGKKLKKKIMKKVTKEENSYDLLGDIMSQMDKKK